MFEILLFCACDLHVAFYLYCQSCCKIVEVLGGEKVHEFILLITWLLDIYALNLDILDNGI